MSYKKLRWSEVARHPRYWVSENGTVLSLDSERLLRPIQNGRGYLKVTLPPQRQFYIHELVLESFVGVRPVGAEVNHKNGLKWDNCLKNLEWVTPSENHIHSRRVLKRTVGESHGGSKLTNRKVRTIRKMFATGKWHQADIARKYGVTQGSISAIVKNRLWKHLV
jgi:hypothetical protein